MHKEYFSEGDYVKHIKSGGIYKIIAYGQMESTLKECFVYQRVNSKEIWIRPVDEMCDGRFKKI